MLNFEIKRLQELNKIKSALQNALDQPNKEVSDQELLKAIEKGDQKALEVLYERYFPRLSRFITRITQDSHESLDVINEVFIVVWNKAGVFRGESSPSTWIMGIAYNLAMTAVRKRRQWLSFSDDLDDAVSVEGYSSDLDDISKLLHKLTPEQRAIMELTYVFGYSYSEIALMLDCSEGNVKHSLYDARKKSKKIMEVFR